MYTTVITTIDTLPKINRHLFKGCIFNLLFNLFFPQNCYLVGAVNLLSGQDRSDSHSFNLLGSAYGFLSYTNTNLQNAY